MRCQKCGFVSFDYLSQCKKCGADLTVVRELLGFSASKSEVPSLLGALLKNEGKSDTMQGKAVAEAGDVDVNGTSELHWQELSGPEQTVKPTSKASEQEVTPAKTSKDELVIELSEDDLEALAGIEKK
jgi:hypothetical protein